MMATIENWNNLNFSEVFEIYPLLGTELIWLIFVVVYWIYWHFKIGKLENNDYENIRKEVDSNNDRHQ
ncbi:MAG: hypothetical protein CBC29_03685 [Methylococcaceae bacterium TMED69]|nr:MAG: hypothetical protein CBC29_03685 [Methylococcaceae bacterium TMED69]|tara:strand:+ start:1488 stop:1691 length:204 start_codon:yes stop_codon:yes gene_type:complete